MPTAEGAVSDLFDRPLFFSLYDWFLEVFAYPSLLLLCTNYLMIYYQCMASCWCYDFELTLLVICLSFYWQSIFGSREVKKKKSFSFDISWPKKVTLLSCFDLICLFCSMALFINLLLDQKPLSLYQILLLQDTFFAKMHFLMTRYGRSLSTIGRACYFLMGHLICFIVWACLFIFTLTFHQHSSTSSPPFFLVSYMIDLSFPPSPLGFLNGWSILKKWRYCGT